jgi:competence protein ComEA
MPSISRGRAATYLVVVVALLVVGGRFLMGGAAEGRPANPGPAASTGGLVTEPSPPRRLVVHVVGAVRRPGLYELPDGSRVDDAIRRAGGPKPKAALDQVNLASPVADGQQVVVPARAAPGAANVPAAIPDASGAAATQPVHLNTASLEELDTLPGVGPVTAQKILDYRTKHGAFASVDELDAVPGIGPARLEQLKELVQL